MTATALAEVIAARRKHIRDSAPCVGCGATLASCLAARGKDPTAPEWFGCCARGLGMVPCSHEQDPAALSALLDEIETGTVRTVEEITAAAGRRDPEDMWWNEYFDQGERWKPSGKPLVAIADMDPAWRHNSARFLERRAAEFAIRYGRAEAMWWAAECASQIGPSEASRDGIEREMAERADARAEDPVGWIRTTALHKALVAGLPDGDEREALAERARHWSTCPIRNGGDTCRCEQLQHAEAGRSEHLTECPMASGDPHELGCHCATTVPEWTLS